MRKTSKTIDKRPISPYTAQSIHIPMPLSSTEILTLFILLMSGAGLSMAVDLALGIRWQRFKSWKWLVHITTLILYGALIAAYMILH